MIADEILAAGAPAESVIFLDLDSRGYRSIKTPDGLDALLSRYDSVPGLKYLFMQGAVLPQPAAQSHQERSAHSRTAQR